MEKDLVEKEKVDALFLGLVRTPERFKQSIKDLVEMRDEGLVNQIIFSTWDYEVEKHSELMKFLQENGVVVIGSEEPKERGEGNIWCQMKSFDVALEKVDEDRFVFKNRSDIYVNPVFLRKLFREKKDMLKISKDLPKGNVFKYKIWVHYYEFKTPFHMGEECLFGHYHDMRKMINYDKSYDDLKVGNAISHIRRFVHPFLKDYFVLNSYLSKYSKDTWLKTFAIWFSHNVFDFRGLKVARKISAKDKIGSVKRKLEDSKFLEILALYYSVLNSHFYIDGSSVENLVVNVDDRPESTPGAKLDNLEFAKNFDVVTHSSRPGQIYVYDMELLNNICEGKLNKDIYSERLMKAVESFNEIN